MVRPPQTDEGWYVLHDFRTVDWDAWRAAPERDRVAALTDGVDYLQWHEAVEDADDGATATFSVVGQKADLLVMHLRPTMDDLNRAERQFEQTAFAEYTDRADSFVSVTEVSGYVSQEYFEGEEVEDAGLRRYIEGKLEPSVPDDVHVCFYPMNKRRDRPEYNWYTLPFEERAEHLEAHGDIGRKYGGKVHQVITGAIGFDDWEWGVTLFAEDPVAVKDLLYEMRFDESTSKYAEFGEFYFGRRFPPADLGAFMAGETVPVPEDETAEDAHPHAEGAHAGAGHHGTEEEHADAHAHGESGHDAESPHGEDGDDAAASIREELSDLDVYAGKPHGEDVYALVLYSEAERGELADEVFALRENFDHYDTHVKTAVYENPGDGPAAVVSIWENQRAADTASGFLADLPAVVGRAGEDESTFGTMGMFYTVKPDHREDFTAKFDAVGELLGDMEGHLQTDLLVNVEDENDMFIASQWSSKDDAMAFFRSDAFKDTVHWGRDVLADRPRHVFLA
ncbi:heme-binding protein [Halobacteriaceae archaeon GCM10025711]